MNGEADISIAEFGLHLVTQQRQGSIEVFGLFFLSPFTNPFEEGHGGRHPYIGENKGFFEFFPGIFVDGTAAQATQHASESIAKRSLWRWGLRFWFRLWIWIELFVTFRNEIDLVNGSFFNKKVAVDNFADVFDRWRLGRRGFDFGPRWGLDNNVLATGEEQSSANSNECHQNKDDD